MRIDKGIFGRMNLEETFLTPLNELNDGEGTVLFVGLQF